MTRNNDPDQAWTRQSMHAAMWVHFALWKLTMPTVLHHLHSAVSAQAKTLQEQTSAVLQQQHFLLTRQMSARNH